MSSQPEVSTSELKPFEIALARHDNVLRVEDDGLGFVPQAWLEELRSSELKPVEQWGKELKKDLLRHGFPVPVLVTMVKLSASWPTGYAVTQKQFVTAVNRALTFPVR